MPADNVSGQCNDAGALFAAPSLSPCPALTPNGLGASCTPRLTCNDATAMREYSPCPDFFPLACRLLALSAPHLSPHLPWTRHPLALSAPHPHLPQTHHPAPHPHPPWTRPASRHHAVYMHNGTAILQFLRHGDAEVPLARPVWTSPTLVWTSLNCNRS
ncbi:hypothetical protein BJ912DRAFT_1054344 [Pholiota molesta]|nr:hypothetical protein BJ912DRAFT_1054344 [Pholiota molesta]